MGTRTGSDHDGNGLVVGCAQRSSSESDVWDVGDGVY